MKCRYCDNEETTPADYKDYEATGKHDAFGISILREVVIAARYCADCGVTFDTEED